MKEYPKKVKYNRVFRVKLKNKDVALNFLNIWFFNYGIKALENGKLKLFHLLALIRFFKKNFKKDYKIKFNVSLVTPVTKKPKEARMGKGKAQRDHWECNVKKGMVVIEIGIFKENIYLNKFLKILYKAVEKLPMQAAVVKLTY